MNDVPTRWAERGGAHGGQAPGRAARAARGRASGGGRRMVCARCRHRITSEGERIEVDGLHEHSQVNPHGLVWTFGCWARAPGCAPVGTPSYEFTWFPGHSWQIEHCAGCGVHLGWHFRAPDRAFHGLIVERLVVEDRG